MFYSDHKAEIFDREEVKLPDELRQQRFFAIDL